MRLFPLINDILSKNRRHVDAINYRPLLSFSTLVMLFPHALHNLVLLFQYMFVHTCVYVLYM